MNKTDKTMFCGYIIIVIIGIIAITITAGKRVSNLEEIAKKAQKYEQQSKLHTWRVTAYCPCKKCCGRFSDGITASGKPAKGKIVAAPEGIPFGTWINIPGYGWAEVLDRGGSIKGRRLDVLFPTHQEALVWGVQYLEIEVK